LAASLAAVFSVVTLCPRAEAFEAEVNSTSAAQSYAFSSPWGSPLVKRRRFLQTLALGVYHLEGDQPVPGGPEIAVKLRLRLDSDAGVAPEESTYAPDSDTFVPGLSATPVDLMYGYIEGRNLLKGWLGFRLGRQYVADSLGWWAFDGGLVRITTPVYFQIEAYGGLEERGGLPLSTPRFERNGVWRGDRGGFEDRIYPQFQPAYIAPAYGVALESTGVTWIHGRLDYRKVYNQGNVYTSLIPDPLTGAYELYSGRRTSSERIGYALEATAANLGGIKGGLAYDLFNGYFSAYYGQVDWFAAKRLTLGADYDYFRPTFDGDSIFNFFTHNPMTTITGRLDWDASDQIDVALGGGVRSFLTDGDPNTYGMGDTSRAQVKQNDLVGNAAGRYRYDNGLFGLRGLFERGDRGHRQGGDLYGERYWMGGRWTATARVSVFDWDDKLRPDRSATSFAYVLGGAFRPSEVAQAMLEWEHDMNRLVGQRFRILAVLNLTVGK